MLNYLFIYRIISRTIPKEFVPKFNFKNSFDGKKIMVFKYILLKNNIDIEKELKILEKIYIENKSDDIEYTLCIECKKNIKLLTKENSILINKAYLECKRLNNKYSREIFFVMFSGNINLYNSKMKNLNIFSKILLHKDISLDKDNYFLGNNEYKKDYDYILSIDESVKDVNISSLVNYLLHPYNKPIFKNGKFRYGYGSISLDGINGFNESINSSNYLFDLKLYNKLELNNKNINIINSIRDYSVSLFKYNRYDDIFLIKDIDAFKMCLENNYLNTIFRIKYFNKIFNILGNMCSIILMIYLLFNSLTIWWLLYILIVTPYFCILPTKVSYQMYQLIYYFIKKSINLSDNKICYKCNYLFCIFIIIESFITRNNIICSCILILFFIYVPILKRFVDKVRRKYYD